MSETVTGQVSRSGAELYDELFVPALFAQFADPVLEAASVGPGDAVLDVGCGTGVLARQAAARVGTSGAVDGVDINPGMLAVAARQPSTISWHEGDAQQLPFAGSSFDAVLSQFMLMFAPDPVGAIGEMARVARPEGRITVAVWAALDESPGYLALADLLSQTLGTQAADSVGVPFALGDATELWGLFRQAGLDAAVVRQTGVARFASVREWVTTEVRGWTLSDAVDDATLEHLVHAGERELGRFAGAEGTVAFGVTALLATAGVPRRR